MIRSAAKVIVMFSVVLIYAIAAANELVIPPLNEKTLVGVWEAIPMQPLPTEVVHMEINKNGESYLFSKSIGSPYHSLFHLVSSEIKEGNVKLHFRNVISKDQPTDMWFEGSGHGVGSEGAMRGKLFTNFPPPPTKDNAFFVKGAWTRKIGEASIKAEQVIKEKMSNP